MFTNKKREGMNRFVCDVSLFVAETPKASIKYHKPLLPIIPFGIVAYGFVRQPFSKQLYTCVLRSSCSNVVPGISAGGLTRVLSKLDLLPIAEENDDSNVKSPV